MQVAISEKNFDSFLVIKLQLMMTLLNVETHIIDSAYIAKSTSCVLQLMPTLSNVETHIIDSACIAKLTSCVLQLMMILVITLWTFLSEVLIHGMGKQG